MNINETIWRSIFEQISNRDKKDGSFGKNIYGIPKRLEKIAREYFGDNILVC